MDLGNELTATQLTMSLKHRPKKAVPQSMPRSGVQMNTSTILLKMEKWNERKRICDENHFDLS
jgi:hypothetical protein